MLEVDPVALSEPLALALVLPEAARLSEELVELVLGGVVEAVWLLVSDALRDVSAASVELEDEVLGCVEDVDDASVEPVALEAVSLVADDVAALLFVLEVLLNEPLPATEPEPLNEPLALVVELLFDVLFCVL